MKKIILLITTFLTAFVLVILGIVGTLSVRSKSETDSQCTIEKIENYEVQVYEYIIREFCTHLVNRYGIDEIETWYFEYYNF